MTRKRFEKLCMGIWHTDRNTVHSISKKIGYNNLFSYEDNFKAIFRPHLSVKSKKQAKYLGEPYLSIYDIKIIEKHLEVFNEGNIPQSEYIKHSKELKEEFKARFLSWGMWNYELVADTLVDILCGKTDIETVKKNIEIMPWEQTEQLKG